MGPQAMAKLQTTCPTFRAALHHDYKSEASALVTILEDEVLSLKKELKVQRIRNEIIYRKIKRTLSHLGYEVQARIAAEARLEDEVQARRRFEARLEELQSTLRGTLAWERRMRIFLQSVAENHLTLPESWVEDLKQGHLVEFQAIHEPTTNPMDEN